MILAAASRGAGNFCDPLAVLSGIAFLSGISFGFQNLHLDTIFLENFTLRVAFARTLLGLHVNNPAQRTNTHGCLAALPW